jgi:AcrR family transcriptional regulator
MDGFQKRTLKKRKAILDTSLVLFNEYGYKNVTIMKIAKSAHVSIDTIYNYFESKENLKKELLMQIIEEYCALIEGITRSELPAIEKLEKIIFSKYDFSKKFSKDFLAEELKDLNDLDLFGDDEKRLFKRHVVETIIRQGIEERFITNEVSPQAVVICFEMIQYYISHNFPSFLEISSNENLLKEIWLLFLNGLKNQ